MNLSWFFNSPNQELYSSSLYNQPPYQPNPDSSSARPCSSHSTVNTRHPHNRNPHNRHRASNPQPKVIDYQHPKNTRSQSKILSHPAPDTTKKRPSSLLVSSRGPHQSPNPTFSSHQSPTPTFSSHQHSSGTDELYYFAQSPVVTDTAYSSDSTFDTFTSHMTDGTDFLHESSVDHVISLHSSATMNSDGSIPKNHLDHDDPTIAHTCDWSATCLPQSDGSHAPLHHHHDNHEQKSLFASAHSSLQQHLNFPSINFGNYQSTSKIVGSVNTPSETITQPAHSIHTTVETIDDHRTHKTNHTYNPIISTADTPKTPTHLLSSSSMRSKKNSNDSLRSFGNTSQVRVHDDPFTSPYFRPIDIDWQSNSNTIKQVTHSPYISPASCSTGNLCSNSSIAASAHIVRTHRRLSEPAADLTRMLHQSHRHSNHLKPPHTLQNIASSNLHRRHCLARLRIPSGIITSNSDQVSPSSSHAKTSAVSSLSSHLSSQCARPNALDPIENHGHKHGHVHARHHLHHLHHQTHERDHYQNMAASSVIHKNISTVYPYQTVHPRLWPAWKKRFCASIACLNAAVIGIIIGVFFGQVPKIQYIIVDPNHSVIRGNSMLYFGLSITTLVFWPVPLMHGRKPLYMLALAMVIPLEFLQAILVSSQRSPAMSRYRWGLLWTRFGAGLVLGLAQLNLFPTLLDLFGASLVSDHPHGEIAVARDPRRHELGGIGLWLGIYAFSFLGSIGLGFMIGACLIENSDPDWGFYVVVIVVVVGLVINIFSPEVRPSQYRWWSTVVVNSIKTDPTIAEFAQHSLSSTLKQVCDHNHQNRNDWNGDQDRIIDTASPSTLTWHHVVGAGEVRIHVSERPPTSVLDEICAGFHLMYEMIKQLGFALLVFYMSCGYALVVMCICMLGSLLTRSHGFGPSQTGLGVLSLAIGSAVSIPLTYSNVMLQSIVKKLRKPKPPECANQWHSAVENTNQFDGKMNECKDKDDGGSDKETQQQEHHQHRLHVLPMSEDQLYHDCAKDVKVEWSSHLVRRILGPIGLVWSTVGYSICSKGPPLSWAFPCIFMGLVGFSVTLVTAECYGILVEVFDVSDLVDNRIWRQVRMSASSANQRKLHLDFENTGRHGSNSSRENFGSSTDKVGSSADNNDSRREDLRCERDPYHPAHPSSHPRIVAGVSLAQSFGFALAAIMAFLGGRFMRDFSSQSAAWIVTAVVAGVTLLLALALARRCTPVGVLGYSEKEGRIMSSATLVASERQPVDDEEDDDDGVSDSNSGEIKIEIDVINEDHMKDKSWMGRGHHGGDWMNSNVSDPGQLRTVNVGLSHGRDVVIDIGQKIGHQNKRGKKEECTTTTTRRQKQKHVRFGVGGGGTSENSVSERSCESDGDHGNRVGGIDSCEQNQSGVDGGVCGTGAGAGASAGSNSDDDSNCESCTNTVINHRIVGDHDGMIVVVAGVQQNRVSKAGLVSTINNDDDATDECKRSSSDVCVGDESNYRIGTVGQDGDLNESEVIVGADECGDDDDDDYHEIDMKMGMDIYGERGDGLVDEDDGDGGRERGDQCTKDMSCMDGTSGVFCGQGVEVGDGSSVVVVGSSVGTNESNAVGRVRRPKTGDLLDESMGEEQEDEDEEKKDRQDCDRTWEGGNRVSDDRVRPGAGAIGGVCPQAHGEGKVKGDDDERGKGNDYDGERNRNRKQHAPISADRMIRPVQQQQECEQIPFLQLLKNPRASFTLPSPGLPIASTRRSNMLERGRMTRWGECSHGQRAWWW